MMILLTTADLLKYADLQMAVEAFFDLQVKIVVFRKHLECRAFQ